MGNKRITEKDFWICTEGNIPTQFQGTRNLQKKSSGEKYIVEADKATVGCMDFGCKKYTMLIAIAAAVAVVALALIGVLTVATGGAALIALGAMAGAVGAVVGSVVGGLLCGQKMASKREWIPAPKKNKTIFQGQPQVTGDYSMTCPIGGKISFATNIKSWGQAIALASSGYITDVLEGMTKGALVGLGGSAISGIGSLGTMFSGSGSAIAGNVGRATLQGLGRIGTNLAEGFFLDAGSKSVEASANVLQNYGETGNWNVVGDFTDGYIESSLEDANALKNIVTTGGTGEDWQGAVMLLAPGGGGRRETANQADGSHTRNRDATAHENSNSDGGSTDINTTQSETHSENESSVSTNVPSESNTVPTSNKGEAFEDGSSDPPGTKRDKNGRLRDEKTGRFVEDPHPENILRSIRSFTPSSGTNLVGTRNRTTTILGRWNPDMSEVKKRMLEAEMNVGSAYGTSPSQNGGFNFLNVPDDVANSSPDFFNEFNKPWLDNAIQRGDVVVLATRPIDSSDYITATGELKGMYARELKYLVEKDYKPANISVAEWTKIKSWF